MSNRSWLSWILVSGACCAGAALAFVNCGGQTARSAVPEDAGSDGATFVDSSLATDAALDVLPAADSPACSVSCDAGASTACPSLPPPPGTPCVAPQVCEYGASWFLSCNVVLRCSTSGATGAGTWVAEFDGGACPWLEAGAPCPPTWDEARAVDAAPGTCPFTSCVYSEGFCGCGVACGGGGGAPRPSDSIPGIFACIPAVAGCPEPRPLSGSACEAGASCDYGFACGCGQIEQCSGGAWVAEPGPACP